MSELDSLDEFHLLTLNKLLMSDLSNFVRHTPSVDLLVAQLTRGIVRLVAECQNAPLVDPAAEKKALLLLEAGRQLLNSNQTMNAIVKDAHCQHIWLHCVQTFIESEKVFDQDFPNS